jgi:hypothetical protein
MIINLLARLKTCENTDVDLYLEIFQTFSILFSLIIFERMLLAIINPPLNIVLLNINNVYICSLSSQGDYLILLVILYNLWGNGFLAS